jgi:hypothetical protein
MRPVVVLASLLFVAGAGAGSVGAQSAQPLDGVSFRRATPMKAPSDFEAVLLPVSKLKVVQTAPLIQSPSASRAEQPIDCAMVKPIDPDFHSNMPIVKPDPNVHYAMPVVKPASCRALTERGDATPDR